MYPGVYVCWGEGEEMWTCSWLRTFVVKTRYHDDLNWKEDHGRREQVASADLGMGWQRETGRTERWSPGLGIWQISDRRCDSWVVRPKTSFPENVMNPVLEMLYLKCPRDSQEDNWWGWVYLGFKGVLQRSTQSCICGNDQTWWLCWFSIVSWKGLLGNSWQVFRKRRKKYIYI